MDPKVNQVIELIKASERPLKRKEVATLTRIPERTVRGIVSELRKDGHPIVNLATGYEYSRDPEKIKHSAAILRSAALDMLTTAGAMEAGLRSDGQYPLL